MSAIRVRTRGPRATMTVQCLDASEHRVTTTLDDEILYSNHNPDHDAVLRALGAPPHACQVAAQAHQAARVIYRAIIGEQDAPDVYANRNRSLRSKTPCPQCPTWGQGHMGHYHSASHQAFVHGTHVEAVQTLVRWRMRNAPERSRATGFLSPLISGGVLNELGLGPHGFTESAFITEPFLRAALEFAPASASVRGRSEIVRTLREQGVKVEWLTLLVAHLSPATLERVKREPVSLNALVGARNIAPDRVARYINAGVRSNFYTYAKVNARPEDVLTVFRGTRRRHTLAEALRGGITIPDALARVPDGAACDVAIGEAV